MSRTARQPRNLVEHKLVPTNGMEGFGEYRDGFLVLSC